MFSRRRYKTKTIKSGPDRDRVPLKWSNFAGQKPMDRWGYNLVSLIHKESYSIFVIVICLYFCVFLSVITYANQTVNVKICIPIILIDFQSNQIVLALLYIDDSRKSAFCPPPILKLSDKQIPQISYTPNPKHTRQSTYSSNSDRSKLRSQIRVGFASGNISWLCYRLSIQFYPHLKEFLKELTMWVPFV